MEDEIERAVIRVIDTMCENPGEQLTIDDLARVAMFSKFHFSRIFRRLTGVPPGRFLSAVRLQEAKILLLSTSLSVADICNRVGYSAVGTFSTRFKNSVGVAPTTYRRNGGIVVPAAAAGDAGDRPAPAGLAVVRGTVSAPSGELPGPVCVGLFPERVPEGWPVRSTVVRSPGAYTLDRVPSGSWHLMAHSLVPCHNDGEAGQEPSAALGGFGPIAIRPGTGTRTIDVRLRPRRAFDPPVLPVVFDAPVPAGAN